MDVEARISSLGDGPLNESLLREHIWPLFSRVKEAERSSDEIYLANHSLGRPLDCIVEDVARGLAIWYERMDGAWGDEGWPAEIARFRQRIANLLGISRPSSIVPKTSAGQGLRAVLNSLPRNGALRPVRVVATEGEFDSIDFILKTYVHKGRAAVNWVKPSLDDRGVPLFESGKIRELIVPGVDLVVLSKVCFTTGQIIANIEDIVERSHQCGALVLVDAYHAAGVIPLSMESDGIDFMIGGSYKYTRGGPGVCWLAIHPEIAESELRTLDTGWFAKKEPFAYERAEEPMQAAGGDGWLESTPPVLTYYQASAGLRLTLGLGVDRLRTYSLTQQALLREALQRQGIQCFAPDVAESFGAFSLLPSSDAKLVSEKLKSAGVITDSRGGYVRFGPDILTASEELEEAARRAASVLNV